VQELGDREPVAPIVLLIVDEDTEVLFDILIDSFSLAISLWMVSSGWVLFDSKKGKKGTCVQ